MAAYTFLEVLKLRGRLNTDNLVQAQLSELRIGQVPATFLFRWNLANWFVAVQDILQGVKEVYGSVNFFTVDGDAFDVDAQR